MEIIKGIEVHGAALFIRPMNAVVISDVHIGIEESLVDKGIMVPKSHYTKIKKAIDSTIRATKPEMIIINGDLKHEFGKISRQEWKETLGFISFLSERVKRIVLIRGNHDNVLKPVISKKGLDIADYYYDKKTRIFFCHGDRIIDNKDFRESKTIIAGHEHPAITIQGRLRNESYKCFLSGKCMGKTIIIMPSLNPLVEGKNIVYEDAIGPFLKRMHNYRVVVVENQAYDFGNISDLSDVIA